MLVGFFCLASAFALSVCATPAVRSAVLRLGWVDTAGRSHRKVHANDIPRLGGVAIVLGFFGSIAFIAVWRLDLLAPAFARDIDLTWSFLLGALLIAALGVYDDIVGATPRQKLLVQLGVSTMLVVSGFTIERLDPPFLSSFSLGWASYPLTILWIVGITNAVNLLDGLDGLAAGVSLIVVLSLGVVALVSGQTVLLIVALAMAGSLAGFLVHNFHPAKIFMGDTGSMFLGFVLAVITVQVTEKVTMAASLGAPLVALALPVFDTLTSMGRRALLGRPVFSPDREHLHHRLMRLGLSHKGVVLCMYACALAFSVLSTAMLLNRGPLRGFAMLGSVLVSAFLLYRLGYFRTSNTSTKAGLDEVFAVRKRNRELYAEFSEFRRIAPQNAPRYLGEPLLRLAQRAGAVRAALRVPTHAIEFTSGAGARGEVLRFEVCDRLGEPVGAFEVVLPGSVDSAVLNVLEASRDLFEESLARFPGEVSARAA